MIQINIKLYKKVCKNINKQCFIWLCSLYYIQSFVISTTFLLLDFHYFHIFIFLKVLLFFMTFSSLLFIIFRFLLFTLFCNVLLIYLVLLSDLFTITILFSYLFKYIITFYLSYLLYLLILLFIAIIFVWWNIHRTRQIKVNFTS